MPGECHVLHGASILSHATSSATADAEDLSVTSSQEACELTEKNLLSCHTCSLQEYRRQYRSTVMALRTHVELRSGLLQVSYVSHLLLVWLAPLLCTM